jgi:hypothetical protein
MDPNSQPQNLIETPTPDVPPPAIQPKAKRAAKKPRNRALALNRRFKGVKVGLILNWKHS